MNGRLRPNIGRTGRIIRGLLGTILLLTGFFCWGKQWLVGSVLIAYGAFACFEAARGWCVVRACGFKTKW